MLEESQPPRLVVPIMLALCVGTLACIAAFMTHRFLLLFFGAGSFWSLILIYFYRLWWPGNSFIPLRRKSFRGFAVLAGLLIFGATWYIIVWLEPSLR